MSKYDTVLLASGGLDSCVLAHDLTESGKNVRALYFDSNRFHSSQELSAVKKFSFRLGMPLEIIDVRGSAQIARGYLSEEQLGQAACDEKDDRTFVPVSGFPIFLSFGVYYAQLTGINSVTLAVIKEQAEYRPRMKEFFLGLSSLTGLLADRESPANSVKIETPYIDKKKSEVISLGDSLKVAFQDTWSCMNGELMHDGSCAQCLSRKKAFQQAGIMDTTRYMS
jgi:7-cyano-7-deazaguanine synthase